MASPRQCFSPSTQVTGSPRSAAGTLPEEVPEFRCARCFSSHLFSDFHLPLHPVHLSRSASSLSSKEAEIARLHAELSACSLLEALRAHSFPHRPHSPSEITVITTEDGTEVDSKVVEELGKVTKALGESREVITGLEGELERVRRTVDVMEGEVEEEKEHGRKERERLMTAVKQLIEAKSNCEGELSSLHSTLTIEIQAGKERENQLKSELQVISKECQRLREVIEGGKDGERLLEEVRKREKELDKLVKEVEEREEQVREASGRVAQERSDHFHSQNLLLQENESLRLDNDSLRSQLRFLSCNPPSASPLFSFMSSPHKSTRPLETAPEVSRPLFGQSSRKRESLTNSDCSCLLM